MSIRERAIQALDYWHTASLFPWPLAETVTRIEKLNPWFLNTFGSAIFTASLDISTVRDAMYRLARESKGSFPAKTTDLSAFYDALQGEVTGLRGWVKAISDGVGASVDQAKSTVALAGTSAALIGVLAIVAFAYAKGRR